MIFPVKIQISKPIDVEYIHVYVWLSDDKHVIWMWILLISKNISVLERIWNFWRVRFAHSQTNFIKWLDRLIFSASINSHPNNIQCMNNFYMHRLSFAVVVSNFRQVGGFLRVLFYLYFHGKNYTIQNIQNILPQNIVHK